MGLLSRVQLKNLNLNFFPFKELEKQIEKEILNEAEEKEKLKSIGGNRLKIEETDGSEEEDSDQEEISKVNVNNGQKKQIKIAEVESEGSDEETEYIPETNPKITEASKPVIENTAEKAVEKPIKKEITIPETVLAAKDKANGLFQAGQYGEASEYYTRAIENLTRISSNFGNFTATLKKLFFTKYKTLFKKLKMI